MRGRSAGSAAVGLTEVAFAAGLALLGQLGVQEEAERDHEEAEAEVQPVVGGVGGQEVARVLVADGEAVHAEQQVEDAAADEVPAGGPDGPGHEEAEDAEDEVDEV
ncbi:hypothetical protein ADL26_20610, partial [Thermoactinomyces vulgaris]